MKTSTILRHIIGLGITLALIRGQAQDATIEVHANRILHPVSRYLTGACIEDVNHEIYGGIYSQMIFGEGFQEPAHAPSLKAFKTFGGNWTVSDGMVHVSDGNGPKIISEAPSFPDGEVDVEVMFSNKSGGNAGLIVKASHAGPGQDEFDGYEVSLEPSGRLILGRHRQNWEPIRNEPCDVLINEWNKLSVQMTGSQLKISVNGKPVIQYEDTEHPIASGTVGLRAWQREASFRNLSVHTQAGVQPLEFGADFNDFPAGVSGMWRAFHTGTTHGEFALEQKDPFLAGQSQRMTFTTGNGEIGIANRGLNQWGLNLVQGKDYEGCVWTRAKTATEFYVALENSSGEKILAEKKLKILGGWQRLDFTLTPNESDPAGQFMIKLKTPGSVILGYAFLQPASWGLFDNLPVRKDVADGLIDQGITVLRYGGSMVNHPEYRWKKMIERRDIRPPYTGTWYPQSSNGWGIFDFLNFCEAAGFLAIPDLNASETPQDMADFLQYVNGPADTEWGRKRAADGHPNPYKLRYIEIGNEEAVNDAYYEKFKSIAEVIWAKDPRIILVVGDFAYGEPIKDPFRFSGAAGGITSLAVQQKIMQLAKQHNAEVWFDIHVGTEGPRPDFGGSLTYIDALDKLADGAKHHVVIFELNANNHSLRRALANAAAINMAERDGRLPIVTSANCLQPDGQNDNGWNQGLLFLNPSKVWLQPPGYVTGMISRNYQPFEVASEIHGNGNSLDVSVKRSDDGNTLILQIVNFSEQAVPSTIQLDGFRPTRASAHVEELSGAFNAENTATAPERIQPYMFEWRPSWLSGHATYTFPPQSFSVIRID